MDIIKIIEQSRISYKVKRHSGPVYTSEDAARERGVKLSQIVKTMLLVNPMDDVFVAVLPGDRRLNVKAIKKLTANKDLRFMDRESMENIGLTVGAIAPIDEAFRNFSKFVDPAVFEEEWVDISSGEPDAGIEIQSSDLKVLLGNIVVAPIAK